MTPKNPRCPGCGGTLVEVARHSKWLNDDQYASVKAGDWMCDTCPNNGRGKNPVCYWWDHEVEEYERQQCAKACRT